MTFKELCSLLDMPVEVMTRLENVALSDLSWLSDDLIASYYTRSTSTEGLKCIQAYLGEDPDGFRLLRVLLSLAKDTWNRYVQADIPIEVFISTMKFIPRFLRTQMQQHGNWDFHWGWWFWRQLSMVEFRIGCLEYELVEMTDGLREISLHIPSDADLSPISVDASFNDFRQFLALHFPDWQNVPWVCDSWMMSPGLRPLLNEDSNILAFQMRFETLSTNYNYEAVLDWVFPPYREVSDALPETTSLQRQLKSLLLSGSKIGCTKSVLRT